jgi:hypothetical protein
VVQVGEDAGSWLLALGVTEFTGISGHGHALTTEHGWHVVA